MKPSEMERAAYIAAHRIMVADISSPELACPGARRSHVVDTIAGIIKQVLELHSDTPNDSRTWHQGTSESQRSAAAVRQAGVVIELPGVPLRQQNGKDYHQEAADAS